MHFLSHYYTENTDNNPLFVAALGIPDLTPSFSKVYNSVIKNMPLPQHPTMLAVHNGILRHYAGDKKFHNSPMVMQQMEEVTQSFIDEKLDRQRLRLSVIAHIAVEMLIDRQIVLSHIDVCNKYYQLVDKASEDDLIAYFNRYMPKAELQLFLAKFHFFKTARYIYQFDDLKKMVEGLSRIYKGATKVEFTGREKEQFLTAFRNIDPIIRYRWQEILNT